MMSHERQHTLSQRTIFNILLSISLLACFAAIAESAVAQITLPAASDIKTLAGNGTAGYSGDGGAATSAELYRPGGVAVDTVGNLYISDMLNNRVRKVTASTGTITTIAGNGTLGHTGDGGLATSAELDSPTGVAVDASGNVYIADWENNRIRKVTVSTGIITTIAGNGTAGYSGDGGAATSAELDMPYDIALDSSGNIYIADSDNSRVRKITASTGIITTIAGNGTAGYSGDGAAATSAKLDLPTGVGVDSSGNVYIADELNFRVRKVTVSTGVISTIAGNGTSGYSGDGGAATSAELKYPSSVILDASGNIYIADSNNNRIRKVTSGTITTFAGNGTQGFSGDGGAATSAELYRPGALALDTTGDLYFPDSFNNRVRVVGATPPPPPTVTSLSRTSAALDTSGSITVTGTNLATATSATITGGVTATVSNPTSTQVTVNFTIPGTATPGAQTLTVKTTGGTSNTETFTVEPDSTTTVLTSSLNPSLYDQSVILSATVSSPGGVAPTGTVLFYDGTGEIGSESILNGGNAALTVSSLSVGTHTLKAVYQGSSTDLGSTSATISQVVNQDPTATAVTLSPANSYQGSPVNATIDVTDTVGTYPTGNVSCTATGTTQTFSGTISNGTAVWTIANLAVGSYAITCTYAGSTDFGASKSAAVTETVSIPSPTWASAGNMASTLFQQTATLLPSGSVLIAGGNDNDDGDEGAVSTAEVYTPSIGGAGTFSQTGSLLKQRFGHTATLLTAGSNAGQVLIAGGENYADTQLSEAELYNPSSGSFSTSSASLNHPRSMHTATILPNGNVLIAGGYTGCVGCGTTLLEPGEVYTAQASVVTPQTGTASTTGTATIPAAFTVVGNMVTPRYEHTATLLQNGLVLIAGGRNSSNNAIANAELFNPATGTFTATGSLNTARALHSATLLPSGMVLITGGENSSGNPTSSAELYNPATGTFTATGSLLVARYAPGAILLNSGKALIFGGGTNQGSGSTTVTAEAELFNPATGTFSATTSLNTGRYLSATAALANGNILTTGGFGTGMGILSSAELYSQNNTVTSVIYPKYIIMGITYAPPGPMSNVAYTDTNYVGNTTTLTNTFSSAEGISLTIGSNAGVSGWVSGAVSGTASSEWTQTNSSTNTVTITGQTSNNWTTPGTPSYFTPVDHDQDIIWLWINPAIVLTADMNNADAVPVWDGYGYDATDPANGMDVVGVPVGYLDGDITSTQYQNILARSWVTNMYWPNGDIPALTATDYATILQADPFTNSNYSVILGSGSGSTTTTDGRFTQATSTNGTGESIYYLQENPQWHSSYGLTYSKTTTQGQSASNMYKQSWSISESFKGSFFFASVDYKMEETGSVTFTNMSQSSVTNTNTQSTVVTVYGPTCTGTPCNPAYSGEAPSQPSLFDVYQDNIYGSLMFWGVN